MEAQEKNDEALEWKAQGGVRVISAPDKLNYFAIRLTTHPLHIKQSTSAFTRDTGDLNQEKKNLTFDWRLFCC